MVVFSNNEWSTQETQSKMARQKNITKKCIRCCILYCYCNSVNVIKSKCDHNVWFYMLKYMNGYFDKCMTVI